MVGWGLSAEVEETVRTATSGKDSGWLQGQGPEQPKASWGKKGGDGGLGDSCNPNFLPESHVENTIS